ncbi:hypothetical protein MAR_017049 [Mya arenaria]|uniref:Uncharacterized protein n=1 Tax=Mya arenaria TaxID=6604 RepID=A0ABY7EIU3_MYAAR|nr:hypothetical protein MAR_017049 [Mya arenaria]
MKKRETTSLSIRLEANFHINFNSNASRVKLFVKKLLGLNLMMRNHEDRTFELHGVVRESVLAPTDSDSEEGVLIARTNALKHGMTFVLFTQQYSNSKLLKLPISQLYKHLMQISRNKIHKSEKNLILHSFSPLFCSWTVVIVSVDDYLDQNE